MKLLVATQNKGKVKEYQHMLANIDDLEIIDLNAVGLGHMDVEETGTAFEENARLKAQAYANASGLLTMADDSGLVVDALDGRPGIYSARYGGVGLDDVGRRHKLLTDLAHIPQDKRSARFVCVIALVNPIMKRFEIMRGICEGSITFEERDNGKGFGYDPIFQPTGYERTFGELDAQTKNSISHRGQAARKLLAYLQRSAT